MCTVYNKGFRPTHNTDLGFGWHMSPPLPGVSGRLGNHGAAETVGHVSTGTTGTPCHHHVKFCTGRKDTVCTLGCVFIS